jgi:hypothetical protein
MTLVAQPEKKVPESEPVPMRRAAIISDCGRFRYSLGRQWDLKRPGITWVMLNPSTADGETDDATIRKCVEFSRRWGFGCLNVVNLFALRATNPRLLLTAADAVGPQNDEAISAVASVGSAIMLAWGTPSYAVARAAEVWQILVRLPIAKMCLGVTKNGSPRHPLYVPYDARVSHWRVT